MGTRWDFFEKPGGKGATSALAYRHGWVNLDLCFGLWTGQFRRLVRDRGVFLAGRAGLLSRPSRRFFAPGCRG
jgi:hypothetical protein